jgi:hypothetical protein
LGSIPVSSRSDGPQPETVENREGSRRADLFAGHLSRPKEDRGRFAPIRTISLSPGFENKIVDLPARDLGATVTYAWWAQRRGLV